MTADGSRVTLLALATALGTAAWFMPAGWAATASVAALVLAAVALVPPGAATTMLGAVRGVFRRRRRSEYQMSRPTTRVGTGFGDAAPPGGVVARLARAVTAFVDDDRDGSVTAHVLAALESQAETQVELVERIAALMSRIEGLETDLEAERRRTRRSSVLFFWGGVAMSVPIGVLINLATG